MIFMNEDEKAAQAIVNQISQKKYFSIKKENEKYFASFDGKPLLTYLKDDLKIYKNLPTKNYMPFDIEDLSKAVLFITKEDDSNLSYYKDFQKEILEFNLENENIIKIKETKVEKWIHEKMAPKIIKEACQHLDVNQRKLAEIMGYAENSFSFWKNRGIMQKSTVVFLKTLIELKDTKDELVKFKKFIEHFKEVLK